MTRARAAAGSLVFLVVAPGVAAGLIPFWLTDGWDSTDPPAVWKLLGLVAELAPALAAGNTVVGVLSESAPLGGLDLGEVLGVSDVPGGVVNLLSGRRDELVSALAGHPGLNAIVDASGVPSLTAQIDELAAESVTRVRHAAPTSSYALATADALGRLEAVTELKTAWHPVGA